MTITNNQLLIFENEIEQISLNSVLGILLRSKISEFKKNTSLRSISLKEKITAINNNFFVIEDGNIQFEPPSSIVDGQGNPVNQKPKPKMKEDKIVEDYQKEMNKLLSQIIEIDL